MKYRKKPIEIEAVQWDGRQVIGAPIWFLDAWRIANNAATLPAVGGIFRVGDKIHIFTLEGTMEASPGDWIIRGVKGELYPCKPDIFEATYDPVAF